MPSLIRRAGAPRPMRTAAVVGALTTLVIAGCSSSASPASSSATRTSSFDGDVLARPVVLSEKATSARFASTAGGSTTLGSLQRGRLMLVYFGYTHCPDVCPTTMADLGSALRGLPSIIQAHTQVVFITSDPARDTTPVMRTWLTNFDPNVFRKFVGLTASLAQIDRVAQSLGVPLEPPVKESNGTISVQHGAQTLAFIDGKAKVLWLAGTTPADYAHDIYQLVLQIGSP